MITVTPWQSEMACEPAHLLRRTAAPPASARYDAAPLQELTACDHKRWLLATMTSSEACVKHLAVVGCGRVLERFYLPALRGSPDWTLVAGVDTNRDRLRWLNERIPGIATGTQLTELPAKLRIDAILIAAPPDTHTSLGELALRHGAHILIEKPLSHRLADAERLLLAARACDRHVWVGFNRRFRSSYQALHHVVRAWLAQSPQARIVEVRYELTSDVRGWQPITDFLGVEERGGGVLDDVGSHQLDLVPWLVDRPVNEVICRPTLTAAGSRAMTIGLRFAGGLEAWCHAGHSTRSVERLEITLEHGPTRRTLVVTRGGMIATGGLPVSVIRRIADLRDNAIGLSRRLRGASNMTIQSFQAQLAEWARASDRGHSSIAADGYAGARCAGLIDACRQSLALNGMAVAPPTLPPRAVAI